MTSHIEGPDGVPWIEGRDFQEQEVEPPALTSVEWGVRDKSGEHRVESDFHARRIVEGMQPGSASVVCRNVTEWREADRA